MTTLRPYPLVESLSNHMSGVVRHNRHPLENTEAALLLSPLLRLLLKPVELVDGLQRRHGGDVQPLQLIHDRVVDGKEGPLPGVALGPSCSSSERRSQARAVTEGGIPASWATLTP